MGFSSQFGLISRSSSCANGVPLISFRAINAEVAETQRAAERSSDDSHVLSQEGLGEDLGTVQREQGLVRRDDVLAVLDRTQDETPGDVVAPDELDHDVDPRIGYQTLGIGVEAKLGGEALPGELMVLRLVNPAVRSEGRRADLIDLETGRWRPVATGVRRSWSGFQWKSGALGSSFWYVDQPAAARLLTDRAGALVRWDPDTGELIHIVGGRN